MRWWEIIKNYYVTLGKNYHVDPLLFLGLHVVATPLFALAVGWIVHNSKKRKSIVLPAIVAAFIFNSANLYLVFFGKNISVWVYLILGATTLLTGYFTVSKIGKRIRS